MTGDRDLFQLVDDDREVRVLYIARGVGNLEIVTNSSVVKKYGILPEQYADFAVLRGDPSDGLPGVKGVGDKTAASLLQQYGDLAGIRLRPLTTTTKMATGVRAKLTRGRGLPGGGADGRRGGARPRPAGGRHRRSCPLDEAGVEVVAGMRETGASAARVNRVLTAFGNDVPDD